MCYNSVSIRTLIRYLLRWDIRDCKACNAASLQLKQIDKRKLTLQDEQGNKQFIEGDLTTFCASISGTNTRTQEGLSITAEPDHSKFDVGKQAPEENSPKMTLIQKMVPSAVSSA